MYSDMEEIGAVTTSLNQLLARLDSTIQQERLFTADAAHELRTPLAGIRLHLELMAQSGSPQATTLISRIDQLMHTVEQLLMLARAGQAMASGHYETINWTDTIITPLGLEHEAKEHTVIWPAKSTLTVQGDAVLLRLMLRNLLENAGRYSPPGTTITVALTEVAGGTLVSVSDQGPGIDEAHRQSITEPFRRLDQRYGGSGLGLSIVQRILQLHRGKLALENGAEGGLIASCWLPSTLE
jgi:two-component system sensor histidine kinase BasS